MSLGVTLLLLVGLSVACGTLVILALLLRNGGQRRSATGEETRMIQQMHQGLSKLEKRIESLETILLEKPSGRDETK